MLPDFADLADDDDEPKTPPDSPSGQLKLGIVHCPCCELYGDNYFEYPCKVCNGGKRVTEEVAKKWIEEHK